MLMLAPLLVFANGGSESNAKSTTSLLNKDLGLL